jgi:hypothetical protein
MQDVYDNENYIQQNLANANGIGNGALGRQNSNLRTGGAHLHVALRSASAARLAGLGVCCAATLPVLQSGTSSWSCLQVKMCIWTTPSL